MWQKIKYTKDNELIDNLIYRNLLRIVLKFSRGWISFISLLSRLTSSEGEMKPFTIVNDLLTKDECKALINRINRGPAATLANIIKI